MNNDLISREALKKAIDDYAEKRQDTLLWQSDIEEIIDNAPTVHDTINLYPSGEVIIQQTRPKGKWEEPFESNGKTYHKCNHCHISSELFLIDNFCPHCGADMRGKEE